jgi:hypothetical protein
MKQVQLLAEAAGAAHVDVGAASTGSFAEVAPGHLLVLRSPDKATRLDRVAEGVQRLERGHRDLRVDDRLGGQVWDRGRADVVDAHRSAAERGPQFAARRCEQLWPRRVVIDNRAHVDLRLVEIRRRHIRNV